MTRPSSRYRHPSSRHHRRRPPASYHRYSWKSCRRCRRNCWCICFLLPIPTRPVWTQYWIILFRNRNIGADWLIVYGLLYRVVVRFIHNIIIWCKRGFRVCRQTLFFVQRRQGIIPILSEEKAVVVSNHILSRCEARHENKCLIAAIINR